MYSLFQELPYKSRHETGRFRIMILVRLGSCFSVEEMLLLAFHGLPARGKGKKQRENRRDNCVKTAHLLLPALASKPSSCAMPFWQVAGVVEL